MHPLRPACGVLAAVALLVLAGCSAEAGDPTASPSRSPSVASTPTRAPLTFEQATAALADTLVPTANVRHCDEYVPGSPEAQEYLDRVAAEVAAAQAEEAAAAGGAATPLPSPTLPQCGDPRIGDLRAASVLGHAFAAGAPAELPVAGGGSRGIEVYEMPDADAAQAAVATQAGDPEGWAVDQEEPREDLGNGSYVPRTVVSGARVADVDLPGWTATVLTRDDAAFQDDGTAASEPYSKAFLWAARDGLVIRVQVVGDAPGQAAETALDTARQYAGALSTD